MSAARFSRRAVLTGTLAGVAAAAVLRRATAHDMAMMQPAADSPPVATNAIGIDNFAFTPAAITVSAGTTVTWSNRDDIPHLVKAADGGFKSPPLDTGDAYSFTFKEAGKYPYFCALHPKMTGTVIVT